MGTVERRRVVWHILCIRSLDTVAHLAHKFQVAPQILHYNF